MQRSQIWRDSSDREAGVVGVVEFLSAFTLFLMILTAFMSLAQLELGSNDPYSDLVDRSAVDGLDRLTNGEGWFVPYIDGVRDQTNSTKDWHEVPVIELYEGDEMSSFNQVLNVISLFFVPYMMMGILSINLTLLLFSL